MRLKVHPGQNLMVFNPRIISGPLPTFSCFQLELPDSSASPPSTPRKAIYIFFHWENQEGVEQHETLQIPAPGLWAHSILNSLSMRRIRNKITGAEKKKSAVSLSVQSPPCLCCQGWSCKTTLRLCFCLTRRNTSPAADEQLIAPFCTGSLGVCERQK